MTYKLPELGYDYNALEPYIDAMTMEIHYTKHHQAYIDNVNAALEGHDELAAKSIEDLISDLDAVPEDIRTTVRNNGGGHANHKLFWTVMSPHGGLSGDLQSKLSQAIGGAVFWAKVTKDIGGIGALQEQMTKAGLTRFGSGWAWLSMDGDGKLLVESTANQDSPLMFGRVPLLGVDVWEHAYYLRYQNRRGDYLKAWWEVVDWVAVAKRYADATD